MENLLHALTAKGMLSVRCGSNSYRANLSLGTKTGNSLLKGIQITPFYSFLSANWSHGLILTIGLR